MVGGASPGNDRESHRRQSIDDVIADATATPGDPKAFCDYLAVEPSDAAQIAAAVGTDVADCVHAVDASTIRHIMRCHGPQGTADHSVTEADFARLPDIVGRPDRISRGTRKGGGLPRVEYRKRDGGNWLVVEEVRTGRKQLALVSMYKEKATTP